MVNELANSIAKWFRERTTSPLYGTFVFSVILWNWKFFYILFWQNEEKLTLPRIEYVQRFILNNQTNWYHMLYFLILPITSSYIIVWWLPVISNWAHKKHIEYYYDRRLIIDKARLDYEKKEKETLTSISTVKKEQIEVKKEIQKNTTEEERWDLEFENFRNSNSLLAYSNFLDEFYKGRKNLYQFSSNDTAYFDALGLITIETNTINSLTKKGKHFALKTRESMRG